MRTKSTFNVGSIYEYEGHRIRYWGADKWMHNGKDCYVFFELRTDKCFEVPVCDVNKVCAV